MSADLSHVRLTLIDFMGVFLPGTVWTLLLVLLGGVLSASTPLDPIVVIVSLFATLAPSMGVGFYVIGFVATLIAGYVAKAFAIWPSERLIRWFDWRRARLADKNKDKDKDKDKEKELRFADYRFPYDAIHKEKLYYKEVEELAVSRLGIERQSISSGQIFSAGKRLLKLHAPAVWEEVEHREAEVRMLASLFLASLFGFALPLLEGILQKDLNVAWAVSAFVASFLLCLAFRTRRRREVVSLYFAVLAARVLIPMTKEEALREVPG
jgi:hypothetical protein